MRKAVTALVAALVLSACGTSDTKSAADPEVATLKSAAASAKPAAAEEDKRPLIRADTSNEEIGRMTQVHSQCLREQGVPGLDTGGGTWKATVDEESGTHTAAFAACRSKLPELAINRLKRENYEEYSDRFHAFVNCIQDGGLDVSADGDGPNIKRNTDADQMFSDRETKIMEDCQKLTKFQ